MVSVRTTAPSQSDIARTALELLDDWGTTALSIDTVARELEATEAEIIEIVRQESNLLDLACDQLYSEVDLSPIDCPWAHRLELYASSLRRALLRHPNAAILVATRPIVNEASIAVAERALEELTNEGFGATEANRLLIVIFSYVMGHALIEIGGETGPGEHDVAQVQRFRAELPTERVPIVAKALAENNDRDEEFQLGLKLLVDGLERRLLHR